MCCQINRSNENEGNREREKKHTHELYYIFEPSPLCNKNFKVEPIATYTTHISTQRALLNLAQTLADSSCFCSLFAHFLFLSKKRNNEIFSSDRIYKTCAFKFLLLFFFFANFVQTKTKSTRKILRVSLLSVLFGFFVFCADFAFHRIALYLYM